MDVDLMKSSAQDQMEMWAMMMQLDKLPQFSAGTYQDISELPEVEFSGGSATSIESTPPIFHSPPSISFMGTPVQEPMSTTPSPAHNINVVATPKFESASASALQKRNSVEAMREMIFRIAVMQPIHIDPESVKPPKRRNVKISKDPQSVAARHRRERISERIRILQRLVPGGTKMDTASMLDEAIHYVKFLKKQVQSMEQAAANRPFSTVGFPTTMATATMNYSPFVKACHPSQIVGSMPMQMQMQMLG